MRLVCHCIAVDNLVYVMGSDDPVGTEPYFLLLQMNYAYCSGDLHYLFFCLNNSAYSGDIVRYYWCLVFCMRNVCRSMESVPVDVE